MSANNTCVPGDGPCPTSGSSAGLAAGLACFFLLLVIIAAVIMYKYHSKIRNMLQLGHRESQTKEDYTETPQTDPHTYTSMIREQPVGQNPIYENLNTSNKRPEVNQRQ